MTRLFGGIPPFLIAEIGRSMRLLALVYSQAACTAEMETLSRREEDALVKATKARALKECDTVVKGE